MEPSGHEKLRFDSRMESELIAAVKFGPKEKIRSVIDGIVSRMEDARVHYRQYQAYVLAIINVLTQLSQQYDLRISEMFGVENDYFEILGRVQKMENVRPYLYLFPNGTVYNWFVNIFKYRPILFVILITLFIFV